MHVHVHVGPAVQIVILDILCCFRCKIFPTVLVLAGFIVTGQAALTTQKQIAVFTGNGVNITISGDKYVFESHGVPDHDHGPFPSDNNPNTVAAQEHMYEVPKTTSVAEPPGCLPMGSIGMAINGVVLFNPYTAEGFNAVEGEYKETFDDCDGHPQMQGVYHYHKIPSCLLHRRGQPTYGHCLRRLSHLWSKGPERKNSDHC